MAKYHGYVGYADQVETRPGVFEEQIIEKEHFGDVLNSSYGNQTRSEVNDDLRLNNRVSIVSTEYAIKNYHLMRYATFMGKKWSISNVDVRYPRLILSFGGVYNA